MRNIFSKKKPFAADSPYVCLVLSILVVVYLINGIYSINALSITSDEGSHLAFGIKLLKLNPVRTNPDIENSKMPVSVLNAIPRAVQQIISTGLVKTDFGKSDIISGRYITVCFSVLIILLVFQWSRKLYGNHAGLFSAFLFTLCPNNLANAVLVTTDTYSVFFLLATMYFLWQYCNSRSIKDFICFAILLGFSQLAKQSLFHLYVMVPLCLLIYAISLKEKFQWLSLVKKILIVITLSWVIINGGFIFWHMNRQLDDYHFMSSLFQNVQQLMPGNLPVPFSESFVTGLDQAKYYEQLGGGFEKSGMGNITILGKSSTGGSFWYYYFVSIFFKTPITYIVLFFWAVYWLVKKNTFIQFMKSEYFLLFPIVYYLLLMSFFYKAQGGIRHIIFIYPLIFIFCGIIIKYYRGKGMQITLLLVSLFLVASVGRYFNNYFPYTNEFVWQKKNAYKYVGANNLNFDQATYLLQHYLTKHPEVKYAPGLPRAGKFVLVVDSYLDIWNTGKYQWLRKFEPVGEVHHSYLLFDIKQCDIEP